ncbi:MAG: beta-lactamase family protein [Acidobacteria bacterium]|nr:beta-lactamase family protein [Acidobacteriota bacterium]
MRISYLAAFFSLANMALAQPSAKNAARLQSEVEGGLLPSVHIQGRPLTKSSIADRMKALHIRGVSVAVIHNYRIDWAKGYGILDDETRKPVDPETLFQAGSISKPVAAAGAMRLIEQGKLALDEDVNQRLKSWKVPENEFTKTEKVTLRRTMSHSAGLTVHGFPGYAEGDPIPNVPQLLEGVKPANTAAVRVDTIPGTLSRYSGGGTTIMQLLMTDVTGRAFPALLRDLVLSKAGMRNSTYEQPLPQRLRANTASGYKSDGKPVKGKYHTYPEMAAAGLWTTASDLARFAIEMGKSRMGKANHILRQATVEQMMTVQKGGFGLGFALSTQDGVKRFGHNGSDEGFQALLTCSYEGEGVAVMVNSDNGIRLANEIVRSVSAAYGWKDMKPVEKAVIQMSTAQLAEYAGEYDLRGTKLEVRVAGDHLLFGRSGAEVAKVLKPL